MFGNDTIVIDSISNNFNEQEIYIMLYTRVALRPRVTIHDEI